MSDLVAGALLYTRLPDYPKWTTADKVAAVLGVSRRTAQRHLKAFEAAGLAFTDWDGVAERMRPARWWRA